MATKKSRILLLIALTCCLLAAGIVFYMLYMPHRNIQNETPVIISSTELVEKYQADESAANLQFLDKAIQVAGTISDKEVNNNGQIVITLSGPTPLSGVRCTLLKNGNFETGSQVTLKGKCTGYLSDVIIIDCLKIE